MNCEKFNKNDGFLKTYIKNIIKDCGGLVSITKDCSPVSILWFQNDEGLIEKKLVECRAIKLNSFVEFEKYVKQTIKSYTNNVNLLWYIYEIRDNYVRYDIVKVPVGFKQITKEEYEKIVNRPDISNEIKQDIKAFYHFE